MARTGVSPAECVLLVQALVARELVEGLGLPGHRAAALLGIAPSAVSQYLSGKRRSGPLDGLSGRADVRAIARATAQLLARDASDRGPAARVVLEAAATLYDQLEGVRTAPPADAPRAGERRDLARLLRQRVATEQTAVADCMQLAQKARDELTRALFRHIASDSLRHAEIAASLASYLERGIDQTWASGITRADVTRLIERENAAEQASAEFLDRALGGMMGVLAASMEADERKHAELLHRVVKTGFVDEPPARGAPLGGAKRPA
ncbi:MAG TPA: hypothetical protein VMH78_08985 [Thermoplasmata archaeon]|nr:hypothetical protein [Thermoplasmata archaeon]